MYKIIGSDQKEYGPISAEQLRQWLAEGRVNSSTLAQSETAPGWKPISTFPELAAGLPSAAAPAAFNPGAPAVNAAQLVQGPAIGMMVMAILLALLAMAGILMNLLGVGAGAIAPTGGNQFQQLGNMMGGVVGIVFNVLGLGISGFIFFASQKLKKLESHGMVMAAAIISMVPCLSPCCIIGLGIGIWVLVVIMKPEVKSAFR